MRKFINQLTPSSLCFIAGDICSTGFYLFFGEAFTHFVLKAMGTLIIGVLGGIAGLAGKDIYPILKAYVKKRIIKLKKKIQHEKFPEETE